MQPEAKVKILLIDNQPKNLLAMSAILDRLGQNLVKAHSGEEALRCLLEQDFAVILLDVEMLERDGFEIVRLIRSRPASQDTPIILITASNRDDIHLLRDYSLGAVDYLLKPIVPEILLSKVAVFISLFNKTQEVKRQAAQLEAAKIELEREIAKRQRAEAAWQRADGSGARLESIGTNWLFNPDIKAIVAKTRDMSGSKQAEEALRQQRERERLIMASAQRIRQTLDLDVILDTTVGEVRQFLEVDRVLVYRLWHDGTGSTVAEAVVPGCRRILGQTFPAEVFPQDVHQLYRQGRIRAIVNPDNDEVAPCLVEFLQQLGVKSKLVVPILHQEELWGLLIAHHCSQPRQWQPLEIDLLKQLAIQVTIAIQQADLYQQVQLELTERKQAEEALRESQHFIQKVADTTPVILYVYDFLEERNVYANHKVADLLGYTPEQIQALGPAFIQSILHPDDLAQTPERHKRWETVKDGDILHAELRMRHSTGEWRTFQCKETLFARTPDGLVRQILGAAADITERKQAEAALSQARDELEIRVRERTAELTRINASLEAEISDRQLAEEALRESKRLIQQIADTAPTLLYIYDLIQDCNVYANRQIEEFFGCTQPEIQARGSEFFAEVLHPEDVQQLIELRERFSAAKDGEVIEKEFRMKNARAEWCWFRVWEVIFTRTADGLPEQILGTAIDITEQKQAEEIYCALETEKELRKLQLRFFSMASHEFRTPLSTILASAHLLESCAHKWPEEKRLRNLRRIQAAGKNMTQLLNDILTINRAETGKLECHPQPIELENFCLHLVEEMQIHADSKHKITFVSQGQCIKASVDEKLLRSILTNLLSNAIKYSPQGGEVHLALTCEQKEVTFQIQDQGIGIPPEDILHLFEPFHRGKNVEHIAGTGLGITVVKKCLDLQGGKILLDSQVGVGTTVTVTIPLPTECRLI